MNQRFKLDDFLEFCKQHGISFELSYSESSDELELKTTSPAEIECLYMKRTPSTDYFKEKWLEKVNNKGDVYLTS